jgi:phospholipid transport system transporter-binding protein
VTDSMQPTEVSVAPGGSLDFAAVPGVWEDVGARIVQGAVIRVDLAGVTDIDSAALAMIVDWVGQAERTGARLVLERVPSKLLALARISELEDLLGRVSEGVS